MKPATFNWRALNPPEERDVFASAKVPIHVALLVNLAKLAIASQKSAFPNSAQLR